MVYIYDIALFLANDPFHILLFIVGIFAIDRSKFLQIISICLLASIVNSYLKTYFGFPLHPSLGRTGFSYPSGHTNFNVVLWGAILLSFRKKWLLLPILVLLPFVFLGMNHYNYHTYIDIFGGICEGFIFLIIFYYSLKLNKTRYSRFLIASTVTACAFLYMIPTEFQKTWMYMHVGAMFSIIMLWNFRIQRLKLTALEKVIDCSIALIVFYSAYSLRHLNLYNHWFMIITTSAIVCYFMIAATPIVTHRLLSAFLKQTHRAP